MNDRAKEYAYGLFEIARETEKEREILDSLVTIEKVLKVYPKYIILLSSPTITVKERLCLMDKAFDGAVCKEVGAVMSILCRKGHINDFIKIVKEYESLYKDITGIINVCIVSAVEMTEEEKKNLTDKLKKIMKKEIIPKYEIDKNIIGGLVIYAEDKVIDGSVRHNLQQIKEVIKV